MKYPKGSKQNPYKGLRELRGSGVYYTDRNAINEVQKRLDRELSPEEKRIVELEGFVDAYYLDDRDVLTRGVGQTKKYAEGENALSGFSGAYQQHAKSLRALSGMGNYDSYSPALRQELMAAHYRGDLGQSPAFRELLYSAETPEDYNVAAKEFLNNKDYLSRLKSGGDGVTDRFKAVVGALKNEPRYKNADARTGASRTVEELLQLINKPVQGGNKIID
tara:strand:- start:11 stop:670 length:660 start_codon:yes stop_codon:yes gene_type:complete